MVVENMDIEIMADARADLEWYDALEEAAEYDDLTDGYECDFDCCTPSQPEWMM